MSEKPAEVFNLQFREVSHRRDEVPTEFVTEVDSDSPWSYEVKLGRKPVLLDYVEFRILQFLSSKPYHAFSTRKIVDAVTTERFPVTAETLRGHIVSLRQKLGFYSDYIQTVPTIGYRFKA